MPSTPVLRYILRSIISSLEEVESYLRYWCFHLSVSKENVVLVGIKPAMNYVVACITFFNSGANEVIVRARGRAISRAVDSVELLGRAFIKDLTVKEIKIGTEEMEQSEGRKMNVSTINILISKEEGGTSE